MKVKRHYIYRMVNDTTGEFYIGKRSCKGEPAADVKYMGSGVVITKKVKKHPEQWRKEILCFARDEAQLNQAERWAIGSQWIDNPLCLNCTPGGDGKSEWTEEERAAQSARQKKYFESEENRAAQSARTKERWSSQEQRAVITARMKDARGTPEARAALSARAMEQFKVRLTSPEGDRVEIARSLVLDYLLRGYTFTQRGVYVQNDELKLWCQYNSKKAVALLLSDCGWTYGRTNAYTKVGAAQVEASWAGTGTA